MSKVRNLAKQVFGYLTVVRRANSLEAPRGQGVATRWLVRCTCGVERFVPMQHLVRGRLKACGVDGHHWRPPRGIDPDALTRNPEYQTWTHIKERCASARKNYGGRGITVCERWQNSFEDFLADMGPRPSHKHSIDRIDVDGNYEPGNCRWATASEQMRNTRRTIWVEYEGERVKLADLAEKLRLSLPILRGRVKAGWPLMHAITIPVGGSRPNRPRAGRKPKEAQAKKHPRWPAPWRPFIELARRTQMR